MGVVIIPFDYEQLPDAQRNTIVPICIDSVDGHGNPIARIWFEKGVAPVQDQLRDLARYKLGDVRRVSELAEITVHKLWERHGEDAGIWPWRRVWARAVWEARDLAAGGIPVAYQAHGSAGAWLAGTRPLWKQPGRPDSATARSMNASY